MTTRLLSLVALLASPAAAFDDGVDVSAALAAARAAAAVAPGYQAPAPSYRPDGYAHDFECKIIEVPLAGAGYQTRSVSLASNDLSDCDQSYGENRRGERCQRPQGGGVTHYGAATVKVAGTAAAKPWENATFRACMEGTMVDLVVDKNNPFELVVIQQGAPENDWTWTVVPNVRLSEKSDPEGVEATFMTGGTQQIMFVDRWFQHYAGQKIEIRFAVKREVNNWKDETLYANTLAFETAEAYTAGLRELDLKRGEKYYVEFSIRRTGEKEFGAKQKKESTQVVF